MVEYRFCLVDLVSSSCDCKSCGRDSTGGKFSKVEHRLAFGHVPLLSNDFLHAD